jgi:hypothetical protein
VGRARLSVVTIRAAVVAVGIVAAGVAGPVTAGVGTAAEAGIAGAEADAAADRRIPLREFLTSEKGCEPDGGAVLRPVRGISRRGSPSRRSGRNSNVPATVASFERLCFVNRVNRFCILRVLVRSNKHVS